ncbi:MAG: ATPase, partial [Theionarchaea archaeon]|nr:ATPase [Theionarchaea archaeon]
RKIPAVAFGELLPTGSQSLRMVNNILIANLPAFLALTKKDTTDIASTVREYSSYTLGCPLLKAVHRKYPHMKLATAKRIFREVRAGVLEPGEALKYLKSMI